MSVPLPWSAGLPQATGCIACSKTRRFCEPCPVRQVPSLGCAARHPPPPPFRKLWFHHPQCEDRAWGRGGHIGGGPRGARTRQGHLCDAMVWAPCWSSESVLDTLPCSSEVVGLGSDASPALPVSHPSQPLCASVSLHVTVTVVMSTPPPLKVGRQWSVPAPSRARVAQTVSSPAPSWRPSAEAHEDPLG